MSKVSFITGASRGMGNRHRQGGFGRWLQGAASRNQKKCRDDQSRHFSIQLEVLLD